MYRSGKKRRALTCNPNSGLTQFVAATIACEMTCPPKTPRAALGWYRLFDRKRLTSICSSSKEVEIMGLSAWFASSIVMEVGSLGQFVTAEDNRVILKAPTV